MVLIAVGTLVATAIFLLWITPMSKWPLYDWAVSAGIVSRPNEPQLQSNGHAKAKPAEEVATNESSDSDSESLTPKAEAVPSLSLPSVPVFSIDEASTTSAPAARTTSPKPASPKPPSLAAHSLPMPSLPRPTPQRTPDAVRKSAAELMPPPSVKASALRPLPKLSSANPGISSSLAPPPSAASSLRVPSGRAPTQQGQSLSTSTLPPAKRPSRKVQLEPGHSPLDWANLKRYPPSATFLRGKDVPPERLIKVLPSEVKARNGRRGNEAWGTWHGKVYNMTPYVPFHPGGVGEIMRGAGKIGDAERLFNEVHPWVSWEGMLDECLIGLLVSEEEARAAVGNQLDEMD